MEKTPAQVTQEIIEKMKQARKWRITRQVPENFEFRGPVPFDISISDTGVMTFMVYAPTIREAHEMVNKYMEPFDD